MSTSTSIAVVLVGDPSKTEAIAVAGFLACQPSRISRDDAFLRHVTP